MSTWESEMTPEDWQSTMRPYDDVIKRLSVPLGCGWEGCEDVVHGIQPFPEGDNMQRWEMYLLNHDKNANHPYRILSEYSIKT